MSHNKGIGIRIDFVDILVHDGPFSNNIPPGFQKGCFMFIFMRRVYISTNFEKKKKNRYVPYTILLLKCCPILILIVSQYNG